MPRSTSTHTAKEDRMAKHIKDSERATGKSAKRSEQIAWATVNKKRSAAGKTAKAAKKTRSKTKKH
ncbi:hypothetical protein [Bdellovibrio sp. HCB274]|uniref:hypothetical protein n=1 Tax=Bdellovibrio sp. HCB274 TaxID=3394361 RepID=UPI0039B36B58